MGFKIWSWMIEARETYFYMNLSHDLTILKYVAN